MKKTFTAFLFALSFSLFTHLCEAQYTVLNNFANLNLDRYGAYPYGSLTASVTGDTLYGMTYEGGKFGYGSVFYMTADGSVYDTLLSFTGTNGEYPQGTLTLSGNMLYGMTAMGGVNGYGVVFSVHTNGSAFNTLYSFGLYLGWGYFGDTPYGSLTLSNGVLFGMTSRGGKGSYGNIFRINTDGTHFDTLHSFSMSGDGNIPDGSLTILGNVLYGMTLTGGANNMGIIFSIDTNGTAYTIMHSFGTGSDGANPIGSMILSGNILYGMTNGNGKFSGGNIFSIHIDGTQYDTLHSFGVGTADGTGPIGDLTLVGNTLYGMTVNGGQKGYGNLFSIHTDGTMYDTLHNFGSGTDGQSPAGSLTYDANALYGMTKKGGTNLYGNIFKFKNALLGINTITAAKGSVNVYPNPSNGVFEFGITNYESGMKYNAEVYNMLGEKVYSSNYPLTTNHNSLDISSQPNGIYFYRLIAKSGNIIGEGKIEIQK